MSGSVPAGNGFEAIDANFVEPGLNLLVEVRFGVRLLGWWASCPCGSEVLSYGETAIVALGSAVVSSDALIRPVLSTRGQFIVPYLYNKRNNS